MDAERRPSTSGIQQATAMLQQGITAQQQGQLALAQALYEQILTVEPAHAEALHRLGLLAAQRRDPARAAELFGKALNEDPGNSVLYCNRGMALQELNQPQEALQCFDRAIALRPEYALAHGNRGVSLRSLGRLEEALVSYDAALAHQSSLAITHSNRAVLLGELDRRAESLAGHSRALSLQPDNAIVRWNAGLAHLLSGRMDAGWQLYESRPDGVAALSRPQPLWRGETLDGKRLLLHCEQGLGDTIQFSRYARLAEGRGARVSLAAPRRLHRLLSTLSPTVQLLDEEVRSGEIDYQCPLLSLPLAFGTALESVPHRPSYLSAESWRVAQWRERLGGAGFRIGICWQGNPHNVADLGRSPGLEPFGALAGIPGVRLISLQRQHGTEQLRSLPPGLVVEELGEDFDAGPDAFIDTAAVMQSMDLIISGDTAIPHLAAALGRPTWVALKHVPEWRWLLDREDSPWYPSMRLFRQSRRGDWQSAFEKMRAALADRLQNGLTGSVTSPPPVTGRVL
jgi:tetratricopeptide (TPR) repeat protein